MTEIRKQVPKEKTQKTVNKDKYNTQNNILHHKMMIYGRCTTHKRSRDHTPTTSKHGPGLGLRQITKLNTQNCEMLH